MYAFTKEVSEKVLDMESAAEVNPDIPDMEETDTETSAIDMTDDQNLSTEGMISDAASEWNLILVNRWNPIPQDYGDISLTQLKDGQAVDSRIYPDLQKMFDDMRAEGMIPKISSSYRTREYQQKLMDEKIVEYENQGNSSETAKALAQKWVAVPGTSEHELGLSVDITSADRNRQNPSVIWQWLNENCYEYGFIQRYPEDKTEITGVIDEPWHYRYVGRETAMQMKESGQCLEEYLEN